MTREIRVLITEPGSMTVTARTMRLGARELNELVGGHIEHVTLAEDLGLYCNDEGRITDPPMEQNEIASRLYWAARRLTPNDLYDIRGVAVLVGPPDEEGDDTSVPDHVVLMMAGALEITLREE